MEYLRKYVKRVPVYLLISVDILPGSMEKYNKIQYFVTAAGIYTYLLSSKFLKYRRDTLYGHRIF